MFGTTSFQELIILIIVIGVLSMTPLWKKAMRGLRELRGEDVEPENSGNSGNLSKTDMEVFFRMLGISPSSTWEEIEQAYRQKAKVHHPDRGGDEDAMRALNEAYTALKKLRRK